jgi:hypothetical protein
VPAQKCTLLQNRRLARPLVGTRYSSRAGSAGRGEACLTRRASDAADPWWHASTASLVRPPPCPSPHPAIADPTGPAGQAAPDPYRTGDTAPPCQVGVELETTAPPPVGARRCLARRAGGAAHPRGMDRPRARSHWHCDHRPTTAFAAAPGQQVEHRLTSTGQGRPSDRSRTSVSPAPDHPPRGEARRAWLPRVRGTQRGGRHFRTVSHSVPERYT